MLKILTMNLQAYLAFNSNCQEALDYYCEIFNSFVVTHQMYVTLEKTEKIFDKLSSESRVLHKFRHRDWGHFGRCTDKYGIDGMVNFNG